VAVSWDARATAHRHKEFTKNERDAPNFLHAALDKSACAPFFKERRMKWDGTHETSQEIGDMGHQDWLGR
jgi:hypothetical protein